MKYIKVENGEIIGIPQNLPMCWENITNFHLLSDEKLKDYNWYPFVEEPIVITDNEKFLNWSIVLENDKVIKRPNIVQLTQEEIDTKNQVITTQKWADVRASRNLLLADSDWTQLADSPVYNKDDWKIYRQQLRDITQAQNPEDIAWPVKPRIMPFPPPEVVEQPAPTQTDPALTDQNTPVDGAPV